MKCFVFLSGAKPPEKIQDDTVTICADSGILPLIEQGIFPDYLVGDMDSISGDMIELASSKGTEIRTYPMDKDLGDGEIALRLALSKEPDSIEIFGGKCGRSDHVISSIQLLSLIPPDIESSLHLDNDLILLIRGGEERDMRTDHRIISLLPVNTSCIVTIKGLKWEIDHEEISFGSTRCIHNENIDSEFVVSTDKGDIYLIMSDETS
jgi:thiamine pyrophosphokinase